MNGQGDGTQGKECETLLGVGDRMGKGFKEKLLLG